jgi:hypothetical protein
MDLLANVTKGEDLWSSFSGISLREWNCLEDMWADGMDYGACPIWIRKGRISISAFGEHF